MSSVKHIEWIDSVKSFGMLLVVWGHFLPANNILRILIYSFHVPLFFIVSGYLDEELGKGRRFRFRALAIPYLFWCTLSIVIWALRYGMPVSEICRSFLPIDGFSIWNAPLWYLWAIFWVEAVAPRPVELYAAIKDIHNLRYLSPLLVLLILSLVGVGFGVKNFMACRQIWLGVGFHIVGALLCRMKFSNFIESHKVVLVPLLVGGVAVAVVNGPLSIYGWWMRSISLLFVSAIAISVV